ncbi:choice-of-anchor J domain-containing protein [Massilia sp. YIM B02769]|uniref:choice-of-anchor J family PEP-CTERM protein n=1 Tax=Massilia sp. YIM B02769 TaxID=3050129 RepID=UPI0025B690FD|nr:choice-of-anchor J domain-containing protein [Massilia sp. YIM B02769]MDN4060074.1 choice-of-anchor J domain-containing protein [Massilia sp. YIM B02769]
MNTLKSYAAAGALALATLAPGAASAAGVEILNEGFGNVAGLTGWTLVNNSSPAGSSWFQGNADVFGAQSGAADSYAAASFLGAANGQGVVDNWLITPVLTLTGLTNFSFYTAHEAVPGFSDFLEVRWAPGSSGGTTAFGTLLATFGGVGSPYPTDWTAWSSNLNLQGEGRFAFRYVGYADSLNYVGLDTVRVVTAVPEPSLYAMLALGLGALTVMRRRQANREAN